jgi:hypothetical protein
LDLDPKQRASRHPGPGKAHKSSLECTRNGTVFVRGESIVRMGVHRRTRFWHRGS